MATAYTLEFEKPLAELERQIDELKRVGDDGLVGGRGYGKARGQQGQFADIVDTRVLQQLAADGIRMAVVSNKQEALSRQILKALAIDGFFDSIAGGDTFPEMKPSPLPLIRVIDELSGSPADAVMVGDSINDIQAGNRAGITTIGCTWGYGNRDELREAIFTADSCSDIINRLRQLD